MAEKTGCLEQIRQFGPIRATRAVGLTIAAAGFSIAEKLQPLPTDQFIIDLLREIPQIPFVLLGMAGEMVALTGFANITELGGAGWGIFPSKK